MRHCGIVMRCCAWPIGLGLAAVGLTGCASAGDDGARRAATIAETAVYARPDLLAVTRQHLHFAQLVAASTAERGWVRVVSADREAMGWVPASTVSFDPTEVAVARQVAQLLALTSASERRAKIRALMRGEPTAPILQGATLMAAIDRQLNPSPVRYEGPGPVGSRRRVSR